MVPCFGVILDYSSRRTWHLRGDTEGVRQLGLARSELSEGFGNGHRFDAPAQQLVQLATSSCQAEDVATIDGRLKINLRLKVLQSIQLHLVSHKTKCFVRRGL